MAEIVRFANCIVNVALRTLQLDGEPVAVAPLVFDCLAYLIRHRDRAVGRDELVAAVWGKVDVSDAALAKTILTARRAIGDDGEMQRYLRTVPRFGYCWVAETEIVDTSEARRLDVAEAVPQAIPASAAPAVATVARRRSARLLIGLAALALVAVVAAAFVAWRHRAPVESAVVSADGERPANVVAVLPADVAATTDDGWLRLGLMDMIATHLAGAGLPVLPSDNVVRVVPSGTRPDEAIARVRKATERSRLIVPAVRRSGPDWIVRAQLIDADGGSQAVEVQSSNVIAAAGQLADRLLERLGRLAPGQSADAALLPEAELLQRIDATRLARQPEQALALIATATPALQTNPAVRLRKAQIALDLGRIEPARAELAALIAQLPTETDPDLSANAQRSLCIALSQLGRTDEALKACDGSIRLLEGRGTPSALARTYNNRGIVRLIRGEYALAGQDFARARIAANLATDVLLLAQIEGNESNMQTLQGHYAEVATIQQRIGKRFEQFGMIDEYVNSQVNQTTAWIGLLHPQQALEASSLAMAELPRVEHAGIRVQTYLARANALELAGEFGAERVLLDRAVQETAEPSLARERAIARASQARVELATGEADAALLSAQQGLDGLHPPVAGVFRADAWLTLVRSLDALQRIDESGHEVQAFSDWAGTVDDLSITLSAELAVAEQAAAAGRTVDAEKAYASALEMARRWSVPDLMRQVVVSYGVFLLGQGDLPRASAIIGQVSSHAETDFEAALLQARLYRALDQPKAFAVALEQARRLAGERAIPPALTAPAPVVVPRSSAGNGAEIPLQ